MRRFIPLVVTACGLALASCHAAHTDNTTTMEGRLVGASSNRVLVEVGQSGSLSNQLSIGVARDVKVFAGKKELTLAQVQPGSAVKLWRDRDNHQVKRIELQGYVSHEDDEKTVDPNAKK